MKRIRHNFSLIQPVFWNLLTILADFRMEMPVKQAIVYHSYRGDAKYYRCPRCSITLEREFMFFCDRCGQRLDWTHCEQAEVVWKGQTITEADDVEHELRKKLDFAIWQW